MRQYQRRLVDDLLDRFCADVPAVVLRGPRAVGKSATASQRAKTIFNLEDPDEVELLVAQPDRLRTAETPILVDEWQRWPTSWDKVRSAVDADPTPNRFLLAGSSAPAQRPSHSGAGRFLFLRMRPMSLVERGVDVPSVSLAELLAGDTPDVHGETAVTLRDYAEEVAKSGFPAMRSVAFTSREEYIASYLDALFSYPIDGGAHDPPSHDADLLRRWSTAYASATATTASYTTIRDASSEGDPDDVTSKGQAASVRRTLLGAYVLDPLEAWLPASMPLRRLGEAPKHHLSDPALAASLLGVDVPALVDPGARKQFIAKRRPLMAALFESLVAQSVRIYADYNRASTYHLRTHGGEHEVDLIVERRDGAVVALEVKLRGTPTANDYRHLRWLKSAIGDRFVDGGIITSGAHAYRHPETGFAVIPAALLGP